MPDPDADLPLSPEEEQAQRVLMDWLDTLGPPPDLPSVLASLRRRYGPGPQLVELSRRFPDGFIERKDGNDFVAHHVVNQRLLSALGPFEFELVEIIRGDVPAIEPDPQGRSRRAKAGTPALHNVVVGGVWRLSVVVDGRLVKVEEAGDVGDVHNWPHDGARLKDAASDAIKRCAMRLGLGLHLWAQEHYFLDKQLARDAEQAKAEQEAARRDH